MRSSSRYAFGRWSFSCATGSGVRTRAVELLEDQRQVTGGDPHPVVDDLDEHLAPSGEPAEHDRAVLFGVTDRVLHGAVDRDLQP